MRNSRPVLILLALTFAATLLSQSIMDGLSILLCIWLLVLYFKSRNTAEAFELFPKTGLELVWIFWFLVIALGFMANATTGAPWAVRLIEFKWILLLYFTLAALQLIPWQARIFTLFFSSVMILCSGSALLIFFIRHQDRLEGFLNPMTYAHMYGLCLCLLMAMGLLGWKTFLNEKLERYLWVMATALTALSVLLSFTRGVWIGCFIAVLLMGFVLHWLLGLVVTAGAVLFGGGLFLAWPSFQERVLQAFDYQNNYDLQRYILWKTNWYIFTLHPVLGIGYGENSRRLREFYDQLGVPPGQFESHAHNQYLHFLAGTGILGTGIYIFLAFYFLYQSFLLVKRLEDAFFRSLALGCFGALICFYASGFTESNFEHAKVRMIVIFIWSIILMLKLRYSKKNLN